MTKFGHSTSLWHYYIISAIVNLQSRYTKKYLMSKVVHVQKLLSTVCYEIQPIRYSDALRIVRYLRKNLIQIFSAILLFGSFSIQTSKDMIKMIPSRYYILTTLWFVGFLVFWSLQFASLWLIGSLFTIMFANLGERGKDDEFSAYSVFNKGFKAILGTITAEQFDREIRHRANFNVDEEVNNPNAVQEFPHHGPLPPKQGKKNKKRYEERNLRRLARMNMEDIDHT